MEENQGQAHQGIRGQTSVLLEEVGHLTNRDVDKAEMFNASFTSVFNTDDGP